MNGQRVIEQRRYGAVVEIDGEEIYVPRLISVRSGRIVRHLGDGTLWRALDYRPATQWRLARWGLQNIAEPWRVFDADAQDVFCHAEDNPEVSGS